MNYLGHAVLSPGDRQILTGNMIADHVKGRLALQELPDGIRKGILLHRAIDKFTDEHPATQRAKIWFRETYGLYAGPILDPVYDHFLANDPKHFAAAEDLLQFSAETYAALDENEAYLPAGFKAYFSHMKEYNWLYGYRNVQGLKNSLAGMQRRAKYMPPADEAYQIFISRYYQLAQCYYELMDDAVRFVKVAVNQ